MAAEKINGQHDDIYHQQTVDDDGSGARINADNKGQSGDEFQIRDNDGNQIDENRRKKVISVYNFGEIGRRCDFMETGIDKGQAENPARRQFDPAVVDYGQSEIIQPGSPPLPSPENRR